MYVIEGSNVCGAGAVSLDYEGSEELLPICQHIVDQFHDQLSATDRLRILSILLLKHREDTAYSCCAYSAYCCSSTGMMMHTLAVHTQHTAAQAQV